MKFTTTAQLLVATTAILLFGSNHVAAQTPPMSMDNRFEYVNCYGLYSRDTNMDYLGGMFFSPDGTTMYIVRGAEDTGAYIAKLPVLRDALNGRIIGFGDPPAATGTYENVFASDYIGVGFNAGAGGRFYYTKPANRNGEYISQAEVTFNGADATFNKIYNDTIAVAATAGAYAYSANTHSSITDPTTGEPALLVGLEAQTGTGGFGPVYLVPQVFNATENAYISGVEASTQLFMNTDLDYISDLQFVPSGSLMNYILTSDFENGGILLYDIDTTSGYAVDSTTGTGVLGTSNPTKTTLFTNVAEALGVVFDPVTNDFLVSTWSSGSDAKICQFRGFPPGNDIDLLTQTLNDALGELAALIAISNPARARRDLVRGVRDRHLKPHKSNKSESASESKATPKSGSKAKAKSESKAKSSKAKSSSSDEGGHGGVVEVPIPSSAELSNTLLSGDTSSTVQAVNDIFGNGSFTDDVLSGGDTTVFENNIAQVQGAVDTLVAANPATLDAAQNAEWEAAAAAAQAALAFLATSTEHHVLTTP